MGSYGVIKEALLVKKNGSTAEYSVVQKLVPATVNGIMVSPGDGFVYRGKPVTVKSVYHGGAFSFSEAPGGPITVKVNIPGYGVKVFDGEARVQNVNGVGQGVLIEPAGSDPTAPYTHLCLVVESPGSVFDEN